MTPIFRIPFKHGRHSHSERVWRGVMLHWPGGSNSALKTAEYTDREGSGGWYHYVVDEVGTYECRDPLYYRGAHAGSPWNDHYIGVCIASPILVGPTADQRIRDRRLEVVKKSYNDQTVYSLDAVIAAATMALVSSLCDRFGIPFEFHESLTADIDSPDYRGILCHHHVNPRKWDCIPWMPELLAAFDVESAFRLHC